MYNFLLKWDDATEVHRRDRQCFIAFKMFFIYKGTKKRKNRGGRETQRETGTHINEYLGEAWSPWFCERRHNSLLVRNSSSVTGALLRFCVVLHTDQTLMFLIDFYNGSTFKWIGSTCSCWVISKNKGAFLQPSTNIRPPPVWLFNIHKVTWKEGKRVFGTGMCVNIPTAT